MVTTPLMRDYLGRALHINEQTGDVKDYLSCDIGAGGPEVADETDRLGRLLLPPAPPL